MRNNNNKLKAFVRFDGSGRIVPGSLIVQSIKPKDGNWNQINSKECCRNNECSAPLYGRDWVLDNVTEVEGGLVFTLLTNPYENYTLQAQFESCATGGGIGDIATVGPSTDNILDWFVPQAIIDQGCGFLVRHVCSKDLYSDWILWD